MGYPVATNRSTVIGPRRVRKERSKTGDTRIGVAQFAHGGGGFALHGPEAKGAAVLYLKERGTLTFYGDEGGVTRQAP